MAYYLNLECGNGYAYHAGSGTLICTDTGPNAVVGVSQSSYLTSADIGLLLSAALGAFALAWGFKMIGKLLFKDA